MDGFLILDKPEGMTSRAVDNAIGKIFHTRHVGHLGTLDPFATGMLVLAIDKANKCLPYVEDGDKTYVASLILGKKTETGDTESPVYEEKEVPPLSKNDIMGALSSFLGESLQIPPMTSAIKVGGEALYKKAHRGESVEREGRKIFVHSLDLLSFDGQRVVFKAKVSKGTYMRVLGEDIASRLGTIGYLDGLRRLSIGNLKEESMVKIEDVKEDFPLINPLQMIDFLPQIEVDEKTAFKVKNGVALPFFSLQDEKVLLKHRGEALAVYRRKEERKPLFIAERGLF